MFQDPLVHTLTLGLEIAFLGVALVHFNREWCLVTKS